MNTQYDINGLKLLGCAILQTAIEDYRSLERLGYVSEMQPVSILYHKKKRGEKSKNQYAYELCSFLSISTIDRTLSTFGIRIDPQVVIDACMKGEINEK